MLRHEKFTERLMKLDYYLIRKNVICCMKK